MSKSAPTVEAPFDWKPHVITEIDTFTKQRTGYIGRAVALRQNGMEFIVMAKTAEEIDLVTRNFMGFTIDLEAVYKATMISSEGVSIEPTPEVETPPVVPEQPATPPVTPEEPAGVPVDIDDL